MEDVTPKQALQNLYSATRKISAEADMHDLMKHWFMIVQKALTPAEVKPAEKIEMSPETMAKVKETMDAMKLDKDIVENFNPNKTTEHDQY